MMNTNTSYRRIFWPLNVLQLECETEFQPSIVVGWKNSQKELIVVTTLPYIMPSLADQLLQSNDLLKGSEGYNPGIYEICGLKRIEVLGFMNCSELEDSSAIFSCVYKHEMIVPKCVATARSDEHVQFQNIVFESPRPNKLQYFSVAPISLEVQEKTSWTVISEAYEEVLVHAREENQILRRKMLEHANYGQDASSLERTKLNNVINQLNTCYELGKLMRSNGTVLIPKLKARKRRVSVSGQVLSSAKTVKSATAGIFSKLWDYLNPFLVVVFVHSVMLCRVVAEAIILVIETKLTPNGRALKDISATAQQVDLRFQQFCYLPIQYLRILKRSKGWSSSTQYNIEYIRFYNTIWLVINDVILGVTVGALILDYQDPVYEFLCYVIDKILTARFQATIFWLMDWPAGLKLNNQLAAFFGELFLWVIQFWGYFLASFRLYLRVIITIIGYSGFLGATFTISMISDLLAFSTSHVYSFYVASARIYNWQLRALISLFHLFRGKKRNILRNRIDSCNYDLDQLLMGTVFFTVLIFLLPTVLAFYFFFAIIRLVIVVGSALLESVLTFLNHFPLFVILLRIKDHKRVPSGLKLTFREHCQSSCYYRLVWAKNGSPCSQEGAKQSYVVLQSAPLKFNQLFHQYNVLGKRLQMHYISFEFFKRILTGQFVPIPRSKLYGLLYSMLPETRVGITELFNELSKALM